MTTWIALKQHGLLNSSNHLTGTPTDDVTSTSGADNRIINKMRQNPSHVLGVQCVAQSKFEHVKFNKYIHTYDLDSVIKKPYKFYHPLSKENVANEASSWKSPKKVQKFQYSHNVRWVASNVWAFPNLWNIGNVTVHLESIMTENDRASACARVYWENSFNINWLTHSIFFWTTSKLWSLSILF